MLSSLGAIFAISPFRTNDDRLSQLSERLEALSKIASDTIPGSGNARTLADIVIPIREGFPFCETFTSPDLRENIEFGGTNNKVKLTGSALQLTSNGQNENGYMFVDIPFSSEFGLKVSFEYSSFGGIPDMLGRRADGVSFFMFDGTITASEFIIGGTGGALGYTAVRATLNENTLISEGLKGAYIGIGFDELGNFGNSRTGKFGGFEDPNNDDALDNTPLFPHSVVVRGPVDGPPPTAPSTPFKDWDRVNNSRNFTTASITEPRFESYKFIDGRIFDPASVGIASTFPPVSVAQYLHDPERFEFDTDSFAVDCLDEGYRKVFLDLRPITLPDGRNVYTVEILMLVNDAALGGLKLINVFDGPIPYDFEAPKLLKVGFAAATGDGTNFHNIRNVTVQVSDEDGLEKPLVDRLDEEVCEGESNTFELDVELKNDVDNAFIRCLQLYYTEAEAEQVVLDDAISIPFPSTPPAPASTYCPPGNCADLLCSPERISRPAYDNVTDELAGQFQVLLVLEGGIEVPKVRFTPQPGYAGVTTIFYTATDNFGQVSDPKPITITINPQPDPIVTTLDPLVWEQQETAAIKVLFNIEPVESGDTYKWFEDGQVIPGQTGTSYTATSAGDYTVEVTSAFGCVGTSAQAVKLLIVPDLNPDFNNTPIRETCQELGKISVSINGAAVTGIDSDGNPGNEKWRIVDLGGNIVFDSGNIAGEGWTFLASGQNSIDYAGLPAGDYIFQLGDEFRSGQPGSDGQPLFRHVMPFTILPIENPLQITSVVAVDELCFGEGGSITVEGAGGDGPATYVFSITNAATSISYTPSSVTGSKALFENLPQGNYNIDLSSGTRCQITDSGTVSGPTSPLSISLIDSDGTSCGVSTSAFATWEVIGGTPGYTLVSLTKDGAPVPSPSLAQNAGVFAFTNLTIGTYILTVKDANGCEITSQPIQLNDIPAPVFEVSDAVACEGQVVTLLPTIIDISNSSPVFTWKTPTGTVITNGSTIAGVTYTYSDHDSNTATPDQLSISGLSAGVFPYTLSVTGDYTCNFPDLVATVTVSEYPPVQEVLTKNLDCFEDNSGEMEVVMEAGADPTAFSYEIVGVQPIQDSPVFTGLPAGTFQIRVINKVTLCETIIDDVEITQPDLLEILDLDFTNPTCSSPNGTITFTLNGGTPAYVVEVNGNPLSDYTNTVTGTNYLLEDLVPGDYSIVVIDGRLCQTTSPTVTLVNDDLDAISTVDLDEGICFGTDVTLTPQISTPGAYTVTWFKDSAGSIPITNTPAPDADGLTYQINSADFSLTISGLKEGAFAYYYRVEGAQLCPDYIFEAKVSVFPELEATLLPTNEICYELSDGTITVEASGANGDYEYSLNGGVFVSNNVFGSLSPGDYAIEIRSTNGCSIIENVTIEGPSAPITINTPDILRANCDLPNGIIQNLNISGGWGTYQVEWRKGSATGAIVPGDETGASDLFPDTYFLIVSDLNGCTEIFDFEVEESSDPVYQLTQPQESCEGDDISISPVHLAPDPTLPPAAATEVKWYKNSGQNNEIFTGTDPQNPAVSYLIDDSDWLNPKITISGLEAGTYTYYFYVVCTGAELEVDVTVFPTPRVTFDVLSISCFGSQDGRISITSGEDPNFVYSINGGGSIDQATLESTLFDAGTYTILVEQNGVGCPSELYTVEVLSPDEALAFEKIVPVDPSCGSPTGILSGKVIGGWAPYSITLTEGSTILATQTSTDGLFKFENLLEGDFDLEVTDDRGCVITSQVVTLTFGPTRVDVEDTTICEGEIAILTPTMAPFNSAGVFKWYFDSNKTTEIISSPNPTADGKIYQISAQGVLTIEGVTPADTPINYYVEVIGTDICEGFLASPEVIMVNKPLITPQVHNEACFGDKGTIILSAILGNGTYTYSLDGVNYQSSNSFEVSPGNYSVYVESAGCISQLDDIEVLGPDSALAIENLTPADPTCNTASGSITVEYSGGYTSGYTLSLKNQGQVIATQTSASPVVFSDLPAGTYTVEISDGSCTILSDSIELTSQDTPILADDVVICEGEDALLVPSTTQVAGSPQFVWYFDADGTQAIPSGAAIDGVLYQINTTGELNISGLLANNTAYTYYVTVTGDGICPPDLLPVNVKVNAIANLRVSNPSIVCDPNETVDLRNYIEGFNNAGYDYMIVNPSGKLLRLEDINAVSQTGDYVVQTSLKGTGCWSPQQRIRVIVSDELLVPDFEYEADLGGGVIIPNAEIQILEDVLFNDLSTGKVVIWNWDFGDGTTSSAQNPTHQYQQKGAYTITLTTIDQFGCMAEIQKVIQAFDDYLVIVPNAFTPTGAKNLFFKPVYRGIVSMEFYIFSTWGELIYQTEQLETTGWDGTVNGKAAPNGNYVYKGIFGTKSGEEVQKSGTFVLIR
ncbi:PKD domain-containing protein [Algoriphagus sp. C2-6-M1]|uniref:PKD domain-containing protein n=1 Tax=Algoriphagus persicinus TaxID=3108754 RepID=UPI002B3F644C|nr:PKD domain-containing protein [Algoriphagus sp. C2-6-M1]MEB2779811.1 PKD domain-containing protein [Algoriphagus sp. C2-6-M1]